METSPPQASERWPAQIKYIVGNEACERFSYYGMRSILAGYITGEVLKGGLGQSGDKSTTVIHAFVSANYFMPLFGAWLSDKVVGRYNTIFWVSLFYCAGHGVLACSDFVGGVHGKIMCLYFGLALIAFGSGGIKPCVTAFMGDQFKPEQSHLLQKAYGAFYLSINFGSFFSFLIIPWIKDHHGYSAAFAVPGILMAIATFVLWLGRKKYVRVPPSHQSKTAGFIPVFFAAYANRAKAGFGPLISFMTTLGAPCYIIITLAIVAFFDMSPLMRTIGWSAIICTVVWYASVLVTSLLGKFDAGDDFWKGARKRFSDYEISAARSVSPILYVMALIPVFWSLFDQTNSTWVLQGGRMSDYHLPPFWFPTFDAIFAWIHGASKLPFELVHWVVSAENMQSANPAIVMILVPLFTLGIYPYIGKFASPLRRMAYGMFLAAIAYLIVAAIQREIESGAKISVLWQIVPYIVLTAGEVLLSATGYEFSFREAAPELKSTIMSFWLLTVTVGDLFVVGITKLFSQADKGNEEASVSTGRFLLYAGLVFVVGILFSIVASKYKYRDAAAAEGK